MLGSGNQPGVRGAGRSPPTAAESLRTEFRRQSASRQRARGTQERTAESREPRREKPQSARLLEEKPAVVWGGEEREGGRAPRSPHPGEVTPPRRGLKNCARPPRGASAHRGFGLCLRGCWPGAGDQIPLLDPFMVLEVTRPWDQSCSVGAQPGSSPTSMMASAGVSRQAMSPPGHAPETKRPGKSVCHCHTGI